MQADVTSYVKKCRLCARHKVEQKLSAKLIGNELITKVSWQLMCSDFIGTFLRFVQKFGN